MSYTTVTLFFFSSRRRHTRCYRDWSSDVCSSDLNWTVNNTFTKSNQSNHRLVSHIPDGQLSWRMPTSAEEIPWGISPSHPFLAPHDRSEERRVGKGCRTRWSTYEKREKMSETGKE